MKKYYDLKKITVDHINYEYFYKREKCDINGNSRFRVFIIDPDAPTVYETIFKTYESGIAELVKRFIEEAAPYGL